MTFGFSFRAMLRCQQMLVTSIGGVLFSALPGFLIHWVPTCRAFFCITSLVPLVRPTQTSDYAAKYGPLQGWASASSFLEEQAGMDCQPNFMLLYNSNLCLHHFLFQHRERRVSHHQEKALTFSVLVQEVGEQRGANKPITSWCHWDLEQPLQYEDGIHIRKIPILL